MAEIPRDEAAAAVDMTQGADMRLKRQLTRFKTIPGDLDDFT
jgi:hypothetical protein